MAYVTVINEHQHVQQVVSGHHHLTADETVAAGGSDAGFAPRELLLASLGADTAIALRKYAGQHEWTLGRITVGVRWSRDSVGQDHIERRLSFGRALTAEQKARLLEVAGATPVTSVLTAGIRIQSSVVEQDVRSA
ncbi:MAG TPA: OsmC family protein [Steroidobacteraceae bacterium]|jgi:putative redox protein|nr:OsmC family protein [Steroidobacteraceae bacterium]